MNTVMAAEVRALKSFEATAERDSFIDLISVAPFDARTAGPSLWRHTYGSGVLTPNLILRGTLDGEVEVSIAESQY
jgi:hypothetical protein